MKYLLFIFLLLLNFNVFSADINWSLSGTASASGGSGSADSVNDNNISTYYSEIIYDEGELQYSVTVMFSKTVPEINSVEIYHNGTRDNFDILSYSIYIQLYYDSAWNTVETFGPTIFSSSDRLDAKAGTWNNVEGIKFYISAAGRHPSVGTGYISHKTYELIAFGPGQSKYIITFY